MTDGLERCTPMPSILTRILGRGKDWQPEDNVPLLTSKLDRIVELCRGKDVLDIGCVGGDTGINVDRTSHAQFEAVARSCMGIDIVEDEIARWRTSGHDVVLADAEDFVINRKFDIIVASDLIEHLANPGKFLERARHHLKKSGRLCIVTPNAHSFNNVFKSLLGLEVESNPEHACWYDRTTLRQLLARFGFRPIEEYWQDYKRHSGAALLLRFRRNLAAHMIVVASLQDRRGSV